MPSIFEKSRPWRVAGLPLSARAYLSAQTLANEKEAYPLVLCPTNEHAEAFLESLSFFSKELSERFELLFFPAYDPSPYSSIAPSLQTRFARLKVLHALSFSTKIPFIVSTLPALNQVTAPENFFKQHSVKVAKGEFAREKLSQALREAGYQKVDMVEDPGTFGGRGEIVDIFPPHLDLPIRAEFFDDEIERIRFFDPDSQRTKAEELNLVWVGPAREVLFVASTSLRLKQKLKEEADQRGLSRTIRDPLLTSVKEGVFFEKSDFWGPFAYEKKTTLWDYYENRKLSLLVQDEASCLSHWKDFLATQEDCFPQSHFFLPEVSALYPFQLEGEKDALFFDSLETPSHTYERYSVETFPRLPSLSLDEWEKRLRMWLNEGFQVRFSAPTDSKRDRMRFLLQKRNFSLSEEAFSVSPLMQGFLWNEEGVVLITEEDLLGSSKKKRPRSSASAKTWSALQVLTDLELHDLIVHRDHGIGKYQGLTKLKVLNVEHDFLLIEYAQADKLYVPIYRLNVIQKYVGSSETVSLDRLGSQRFEKAKESVKDAVQKLAFDLIQLYAERKMQKGLIFGPPDSSYERFSEEFPFEETPDQQSAIDAILSDLESGQMMDRLICGDVGYGKTEVAMRAAFRAVSEGKQVAVLVPTTLLAYQHEQSFLKRFKSHPFLIESLSRLKSSKEQKAVLERITQGKVDIVVGTHRLLSKDIHFARLGLIIVDEEHRFGVEHKERLKRLKLDAHVLTLTATPIPRTLHMALSGLREISLIATPPVNRLPIRTYVSAYDETALREAIEFELQRGGQVFYLHNRIATLGKTGEKIQALVPSAKIAVCHAQMDEKELEAKIVSFYEKKTNVLVCTTLIESGLDLPSANTLLVDRADLFGLAQLYQIRGRVGRGGQRAYAYFFIPAPQEKGPSITKEAFKRLEVIQRFVDLGSGFQIASHDLEMRGGGNFLGPQQSGHIASVGFDLYTELLEDAVQELKHQPKGSEKNLEPEIKVPFTAYLPDPYVPDLHQRLSLYRRLSSVLHEGELQDLQDEMQDRFGVLPLEATSLCWMIRIKLLLKQEGIQSLTVGPEKMSLVAATVNHLDPVKMIALIAAYPKHYQLTKDSKLVAQVTYQKIQDIYFELEKLLGKILTKAPVEIP